MKKKLYEKATIGPAGGSTRTTITEGTGSDAGKLMVAWKGGETIALVHNGTKDVVTVGTPNPDGSAPISGTITVGTDGEDVVLVYPADAVKSVAGGTTFVPNTDDAFLAIGFQQDGTLTYIGNNLDAREGSGTLKISGGTATLNNNVTMESKIAVWKLTLTTDGTTPLAANQVTLSIGTDPIAATAVNATGKSEWTLCVVPATLALYSGDFTISAKVGTDTYTYTKAGGVSLTKNTYYQSTVTMTKPTLAQTMNTAGMTVKVKYNYLEEEVNYCLFSSNGNGTYDFQSGPGYVGENDKFAKALVVEGGKLVFKQNFDSSIEENWSSKGFSVTFDTSNNTYSHWISTTAQGFNASFISVEVNSVPIALTQKITVSDLVKEQGQSWSVIIANNSGKIKADDYYVVRISDNAKLRYNPFGDNWQDVKTDDDYQLWTYKFEGD